MPFSEIEPILEQLVQSDLSYDSLKHALCLVYSEGFVNGQKSIEERFYYREYEC